MEHYWLMEPGQQHVPVAILLLKHILLTGREVEFILTGQLEVFQQRVLFVMM